jgi:glycosyltransferase involved in cell wall biosynthesis
MSTSVVIGLPVYNGASYLRKALQALISQTYTDFRVIALDDASLDDSYSILNEYARLDSRISVVRNSERSGLISAWNKVAQLAEELHAPEYFAWYSDHDWVEDNWLESQLTCFRSDPSAVLTTVPTCQVDESGTAVGEVRPALDTSAFDRFDVLRTVTIDDFGAGNAVYGLFRYTSLKRFGFLPQAILPDRLLVSGMVLEGSIRAVVDTLRYRRVFEWNANSELVTQRQFTTLFSPESKAPLAPRFTHATFFLKRFLSAHGVSGGGVYRSLLKLVHAYLYFVDQFNSQRSRWEPELTALEREQDPNGLWIVRFGRFIADERWLPLSSGVQKRFLGYAAENKVLRQKLRAVKDEHVILRLNYHEELERSKKLQAANESLTNSLERLAHHLNTETDRRKVVEVENQTLTTSLRIAREEIESVSQRMSEEVNRRKVVEIENQTLTTSLRIAREEIESVSQRMSEEVNRRELLAEKLERATKSPVRFLFIVVSRKIKQLVALPRKLDRKRTERR